MHAVSVVIPCFRCGGTIGRAVAAALAQTAPPLEVIVVDDASADRTGHVLETLSRSHGVERLRIISPNPRQDARLNRMFKATSRATKL